MRFMIAPAVALTVLAAPAAAQSLDDVAAGTYQLDRNHAFLTWTVVHNGLSDYTVNFTDFDATLDFNPDEPTASTIEVTINPMGVESNYPGDYKAGHPDSEFDTWNEALSRGDRVELRGFGAFSVKKRNARTGRNPRTGETVYVAKKSVPFFKVGKGLRERLNRDS